MPPKISVCLVVQNEQDCLEHALLSARACPWCDEILVFDSGSTDGTLKIARRLADRVEQHPWQGFKANKLALTESARNKWVFILDADEEISPELANEIAALPDSDFSDNSIITMPRKNHMLGRHIKVWDPDRVDRLFDRTRVVWGEHAYHDTRLPEGGGIKALSFPILHHRHRMDWATFFDGPLLERRSDTLARELIRQGERSSVWAMWVHPMGAFLKFYFLRGGFLQGSFGLLVAQKAMMAAVLKYARLWYLQEYGETESATRQENRAA